jgi:hypothetical protein
MSGTLYLFDHHFICTDSYNEYGTNRAMGCRGFGAGQGGWMKDDIYPEDELTYGVECVALPFVNEDCANHHMRNNKFELYWPFANDCYDAVWEIVDACGNRPWYE